MSLHEFVPRGQAVSGQFYFEVMKRLREAEQGKRPEGWRSKTWMLHHNNTPHMSFLVREFLAKHKTTVIPQMPYSPDLAHADFFVFVSKVEIHSERSLISDNR
jgi:quinol monooxygenase YgiN